ncbi:hypothetical protein VE25_02510 [Devosia geojensis]|uniref:SH3b domain-containing protein n=1 Tax=Devosia geojensis TaxID=443610 RepID=A0A0F5FYS6_9HYPH|nr:SH3 domain-containing protein [Devosia geojensis]KKB13347.1 hypothetical protein VE25_02510 [Devosia geojensis]
MSKTLLIRSFVVALAMSMACVAHAQVEMRPSADLAVATTMVNVRKGDGTNFPIVDVLHRGEQVEIVRCRGEFCLVRHEGPQGWVMHQYLQRLVVHPR